MATNLDKFKQDLNRLIKTGDDFLDDTLQLYEKTGKKNECSISNKFTCGYQKWYSEAHEVIRQILPNRLDEFDKLYKGDKRKEVNIDTYTIQDWLLFRRSPVNRYTGKKVFEDNGIALMRFSTQLDILKSASIRFGSSLFDIKQIVQADLFDSELDSSRELLKNGFLRASGAVAGVVLEKHLHQVCIKHNVAITKKDPAISFYNDCLKNSNILDVLNWRFIQRLGDLRNLCDHNKEKEPKPDEVNELISGVEKITKTLI